MGNMIDDLDKFLKTDGIRILTDSGAIRAEPHKPLPDSSMEDLTFLSPDGPNADQLTGLLAQAEGLRDDLICEGPAGESEDARILWNDRLSRTEDFIDRIRSRLYGT